MSFTGAADLQKLTYIAMADRTDIHLYAGQRDCAAWVSAELGISAYKARAMVAAAHAIECLPRIAEALRTGQLSLDKTLELCRFATPADEDQLIRWAQRVTLGAVKGRADKEVRITTDEVRESERARFLEWNFDADNHCMWLNGRLTKEAGHRLVTAVKAVAKELPSSPEPAFNKTEARYADALVELVSGARPKEGHKDTLLIHASLDALLGGTENVTVEGGAVLAPEIAQRLRCDCHMQFIVYDDNGCIGVTGNSRNIPLWLEREVRYRDHDQCTFRGCNAKHGLLSHHMDPWNPEGEGPTNLPNLTTLCVFHHKLVHEHGWSVKRGPDGELVWARPDGTRYRDGPAPPPRALAS